MSIQINVADHILFEDAYILVVYKPCSLMVEPDRNGHPNLLHQVRKYLKLTSPSGTDIYAQHIHRLDRPVSGIVLFAKQKSVLKNLSEQFANRTVKKYYHALTVNAPADRSGSLENWHVKEKKKAVIDNVPFTNAERARLEYKVEEFSIGRFLWHITLHTGKFHQIRAQLSYVGCPIIGDVLYNSDVPYQKDSIALHAGKLVFNHPITQRELIIEKQHQFI